MKACILVRVQPGAEQRVAGTLEGWDPVVSAFAVLGQPEVVVRAEASSVEALAGVVARVSETDGVIVSETMLEIPTEAIR